MQGLWVSRIFSVLDERSIARRIQCQLYIFSLCPPLYPLCFCGEEARHKKEIQGSEAKSTALDGLGALE